MNEIVLAGDLGGTNLRMAAVASDGRLLYRTEIRTPQTERAEKIVEAVVKLASECLQTSDRENSAKSLSLAVPAVINSAEGQIVHSPNLPALNGFELSAAIASELNLPVTLENDATAAALGENWRGASKGFDSSICVTLGTGVGGGIIINGIPLRGIDGTAGEIGHICVEPLGVECGCGSSGCLEQYSSASAISRMAYELRDKYPASLIKSEGGMVLPLDVFDAGKSDDALALEVFRRVGFYLGLALAGLVNVLNPEVIVICGGAAAGWDLFIEHVRAEIRKRAFQGPAERARIIRGVLGDDAGILGAAWLAFEKMD